MVSNARYLSLLPYLLCGFAYVPPPTVYTGEPVTIFFWPIGGQAHLTDFPQSVTCASTLTQKAR